VKHSHGPSVNIITDKDDGLLVDFCKERLFVYPFLRICPAVNAGERTKKRPGKLSMHDNMGKEWRRRMKKEQLTQRQKTKMIIRERIVRVW
jgi:hypothetical protein